MAGAPKKQGHPRTRVSQVPCYVVRNKVDQDTDPWQLIQMEVGMMMAMMDATSFLLMLVDVCKMMNGLAFRRCIEFIAAASLSSYLKMPQNAMAHSSQENNKQDNGLCPLETLAEIRSELMQYVCNTASMFFSGLERCNRVGLRIELLNLVVFMSVSLMS
jgi:hypothetical protein